jgi:hypothetical protein
MTNSRNAAAGVGEVTSEHLGGLGALGQEGLHLADSIRMGTLGELGLCMGLPNARLIQRRHYGLDRLVCAQATATGFVQHRIGLTFLASLSRLSFIADIGLVEFGEFERPLGTSQLLFQPQYNVVRWGDNGG